MWSTSNMATVMTNSSSVMRMMSGEPGCSRQVRMLGVGGGGSSAPPRAGAGSGNVIYNASVMVMANEELEVKVGMGGAINSTGEDTVIRRMGDVTANILLSAEGGEAAQIIHGGQGYSGEERSSKQCPSKNNSFQGAEPRERPGEQMEQKEVTLGTVMKEARALDLTWALWTLRALC